MKLAISVGPMLLVFVAVVSCGAAASADAQRKDPASSVDVFKQAIEQRLLKLRPDGSTERQVIFQSVTPGRSAGNFRATLSIRDYGPGYPKNRYYGETCVGVLTDEPYTMSPDPAGGWHVEGRMTPDLRDRTCKPNPSDGVSSIPLSTVAGTRAASGPIAGPAPAAPAAPAAAGTGALATGAYTCWANGEGRGIMNFTVTGSGRYTGSDGAAGAFTYNAATTRVTFTSGALAGVMPDGFYAVYHLAQGRPTVSFMSARGAEAVFCQK